MRSRFVVTAAVMVCVLLVFSLSSFAQGGGQRGAGGNNNRDGNGGRVEAPPPIPKDPSFDPKDFTGYWMRNTVRPNNHPPLTEAGKKAIEGRRPDYLTKVPTENNDPMYRCNPQGFPRLTWEENEPIEIVMLPNRILHLYQWERTLREIWLDGRPLPSGENLENIGPNWYGHSVARWEGNTLVVQTTGVEPRAWLDEYGNPKSWDAVFEERYTRINRDQIEGQLTINDPKMFTDKWVQPKSIFTRMPERDVDHFGWRGLFSGVSDGICAPINEIEDFNARIRDPAVTGKK
jgi:hypothetical protein